MTTDSSLYDRSYTCPICSNEFKSKKVKTSALRPGIKDTDFYTPYKSADPTWYSILVCPQCGYSNFDNQFADLSVAQMELYRKNLMGRWNPRDFGGERALTETMEAHMLALATFQVIGMRKSVVGKLCLRIAWMYRSLEDPKERTFMEFAAKNFQEAFTTERLDDDKDNELMILFLAGELNRRLGNYEDASRWFSMVLADPEIKKRRHLEIRTREQMSATREGFQQKRAAEKQ